MKLKQFPSDFFVREHWIPSFSSGQYSVYLLRKQQWNTEDCLQWISEKLHIPRKLFGYCGNKDKQAITEQYITIKGGPQTISTPPDFSVTYLGTRAEPLHLGSHERNFFIITARELNCRNDRAPTQVINYFGEQRFGENNLEIGFALLHKEYAKVLLLLGLSTTNDPISAIRKIPRHTLLLYVHSVQSQLWNELASTLPLIQDEIPIIGYGPSGNRSLLALYDPLMQKYGLSYESWINRSFSELSLEGGSRKLLQELENFSASNIIDSTSTVCFSLDKGSYATETMKQLFT